MDTITDLDQSFRLVLTESKNILERLEPLMEEYLLCKLKIKQLIRNCPNMDEQIALLEKIRDQDERRMLELIQQGADPVVPSA
jgi:hypothetical protein